MAKDVGGKPHLGINERFSKSEPFQSKNGRRGEPKTPRRPRNEHGTNLSQQYTSALQQAEKRKVGALQPMIGEEGIYVQIESFSDCSLPLNSLDATQGFKLCSFHIDDGKEIAVVFIPESSRVVFSKKIKEYLEQNTRFDAPKNRRLIDSISKIKLADIKSFWTDNPSAFPKDYNKAVWWELWLSRRKGVDPELDATDFAMRTDAVIGKTSIHFNSSSVLLIKASVHQLEQATELISTLSELRKAKETPTVVVNMEGGEQHEWATELRERVRVLNGSQVAVCILDAGVNYDHPLLALGCDKKRAVTWQPAWPKYDVYPMVNFCDHGSLQAGLALFGDLQNALKTTSHINIDHHLESARIIPPSGKNEPELYGAVTNGTASKLEVNRPDIRRVYSLAITNEVEFTQDSGQPTSWSSETDNFASGFEDGLARLFVISAGNNYEFNPLVSHWDQVHLSEIEDPAQSWNALTVGAYTELTLNDDAALDGWEALAEEGDVSPNSRSSVNWGWRKQAPFKPDVVEEGGNWLLSPAGTDVTNADSVSVLTTSGRSVGQLFSVNNATSAATALVSRQAAVLMSEYPDYWPETVRGLIVHSAEWTEKMRGRLASLEKSKIKNAKEIMLRTFGFGVPNLERARFSANHALTLIAQDEIQPFLKPEGATPSTDPKLNEMLLYQLPWPEDELRQLGSCDVRLKVTLSYFIEPNPSRKGYRDRYSYQSHGFRFSV